MVKSELTIYPIMIVFINGPINSGKSTVAKALALLFKKPAIVEIDALREFISWMKIDETVPINLENAVSIIKNFSKNSFDVIVPYPLSEKNYRFMMNNLSGLKEKIYTFTLSPKIEKTLLSTKNRKLSKWETERIKHHYNIGIPNPSFGVIIDNTKQTPQETVTKIFNEISKKE